MTCLSFLLVIMRFLESIQSSQQYKHRSVPSLPNTITYWSDEPGSAGQKTHSGYQVQFSGLDKKDNTILSSYLTTLSKVDNIPIRSSIKHEIRKRDGLENVYISGTGNVEDDAKSFTGLGNPSDARVFGNTKRPRIGRPIQYSRYALPYRGTPTWMDARTNTLQLYSKGRHHHVSIADLVCRLRLSPIEIFADLIYSRIFIPLLIL